MAILTCQKICQLKENIFLYTYKSEYICSIHCRSMEKNDVEVIEYGSEIWINQNHLQKNLILQILLTELSIVLQNLKK